eukprot:jgi/Botrbrau1/1732/Bobra.116_2s0074.1
MLHINRHDDLMCLCQPIYRTFVFVLLPCSGYLVAGPGCKLFPFTPVRMNVRQEIWKQKHIIIIIIIIILIIIFFIIFLLCIGGLSDAVPSNSRLDFLFHSLFKPGHMPLPSPFVSQTRPRIFVQACGGTQIVVGHRAVNSHWRDAQRCQVPNDSSPFLQLNQNPSTAASHCKIGAQFEAFLQHGSFRPFSVCDLGTMKLFLALLAVTMVGYVASECTTKAAVNGPFTTYMGTSTVESADECAAKCTATPGCTLFKFCNSDDACKNYWSRGGPDSPKNSCLLGSGDFSAREPNDWSIGGFTVGQCT